MVLELSLHLLLFMIDLLDQSLVFKVNDLEIGLELLQFGPELVNQGVLVDHIRLDLR